MDNALINIFDTSEKSDEYAADKLNRCDNDYAQYEMREKILSKYQKVVARDVYSFAFSEGFLQVCDEIDSENGKGNAIRMDIVEKWSVDENGNKQCSQVGMQTVITEDLNFLLVKPKKVQNYKIIMSNTNLNSYFGNRRLKEKIDKIFGLIIEVDGVVKDSQMIHLINEIDAEKIPVPNFLINSGHGLHFYYVLDEPMCGLTIGSIDFQEQTITVNRQLLYTGGKKAYIEDMTKTEAGMRVLPMSEEVQAAFRRVISGRKKPKIEYMIDGVSGFLFLDDKGKPMLAYHWEKKFQHSVQKYNTIYKIELPTITPHICRHTFCTNQVKRGLGVKTVQYLMGHADVQTTLNIYTHVRLEDAKDDLERTAIREQLKKEMTLVDMEEAKRALRVRGI